MTSTSGRGLHFCNGQEERSVEGSPWRQLSAWGHLPSRDPGACCHLCCELCTPVPGKLLPSIVTSYKLPRGTTPEGLPGSAVLRFAKDDCSWMAKVGRGAVPSGFPAAGGAVLGDSRGHQRRKMGMFRSSRWSCLAWDLVIRTGKKSTWRGRWVFCTHLSWCPRLSPASAVPLIAVQASGLDWALTWELSVGLW